MHLLSFIVLQQTLPYMVSIRAAQLVRGTVVGQVLIMRTYRSKPSGLLLAHSFLKTHSYHVL